MPSRPSDFSRLLRRSQQGDESARSELWELVQGAIAESIERGRSTGVAVDRRAARRLVPGAFRVLLARRRIRASDRALFFVACVAVMRREAFDRARAQRALEEAAEDPGRGAGAARGPLAARDLSQILILDTLLSHADRHAPRDSTIVELNLFARLSCEEIAALLGWEPEMVRDRWMLTMRRLERARR